MRYKSWREKIVYTLDMVVYTTIVALFVLCASAHAMMDESVLKMGTVPFGDSPHFFCSYFLSPYFLNPHFDYVFPGESVISSDAIQLLNPQDIRYAEDKVDRCS